VADRKITDLTALTTPASADVLPIVDVSEAAAADKNKKITVGELFKGVPDGTAAAPAIAFESDDGNGIFLSTTDTVGIATNGSSRMTVSTTAVTSTLPVIVPDGTAAAPSVAFTGSGTDTGIYSPGVDQVAISTGGSGRLFIDSNGNVGVGISSIPNYNANLRTVSFNNTNGVVHDYAVNGVRTGSLVCQSTGFELSTQTDISLIFATNSAERMRLTSTGLGIGTSSPSYTLDVTGSARITSASPLWLGTTTGDSYIQYGANATTSNNWTVGSQADGSFRFFNGTYSSGTERLRITSAGNVGIGTTAPGALLDVTGSNGKMLIANGTTSNSMRFSVQNATGTGNAAMVFESYNLEYGRFDASGRFLVGTSTARTVDGFAAAIQVEGASAATGAIGAYRTSNDQYGAYLTFGKSRSTSLGGSAVVSSGDEIGVLTFCGADGTDTNSIAARIGAYVDGTPGANDMPGRLVFSTTADGASSPTERMRITSLGQILVSKTTTAIDTVGTILGTTGDLYASISSGNTYHVYSTTASAYRFYVNENGGISNHSANNVNLSDEREKKNIETLDSTWSCLKHWDLKKFHYNDDADTDDKRYGVIAQQVAPHCPEVITDWVKQQAKDAVLDDDGNVVTPAQEEIVRMGVKEQQMMWMAIKALQEAQTRIETLETEVAALKGA
jgi:hypothetical protein